MFIYHRVLDNIMGYYTVLGSTQPARIDFFAPLKMLKRALGEWKEHRCLGRRWQIPERNGGLELGNSSNGDVVDVLPCLITLW